MALTLPSPPEAAHAAATHRPTTWPCAVETASGSAAALPAPGSASWFVQRSSVMPTATPEALAALLHLLGQPVGPAVHQSGIAVAVWRVRAGAALLRQGTRPEHVHVVRSGTFKCVKTSEDGYEQVLAFMVQGEVLGFEALSLGTQPMTAVALEDSSVFVLPLQSLVTWRRELPALDQALQLALSRQLGRVAETAEMMAAVASEVRLARFVVWLSARMADCGQSPRRLRLRMSRRDIASLLGVAHETVSRSFGTLADWGFLRVENREIEILDLDGLKAFKRCTRGAAEPPAAAAQTRR